MKWMQRLVGILFLYIVLPVSGLNAADFGNISINGFLSVLATQTVNDEDSSYNHGMAEDELTIDSYENRLGLQIAAQISDNISATTQLIARGGGSHNYNLEVDWAYADIGATSFFNIHLGKYKIPQLLVSDYVDVGFAYPWVRPPQEVYSVNPLISLSGFKFLFTVPFDNSTLSIQMYYGDGSHNVFVPSRSVDAINAGFIDAGAPPPLSKTELYRISTEGTVGGNILWAHNNVTLHASYFETKLSADLGGGVPKLEDRKGSFASVGLTMDVANVVIYTEVISRDAELEDTTAFPDQYAGYFTLGYRIKSVLPYLTYAEIREGKDESPLALQQKSSALGLRIELTDTSALKLEGLYADPEELNHGLFDNVVEDGWVYSLAVDVMF